jgi:catechol 2,3-dioxygenase-like lactoylglutathione lyase family enzyme
MAGIDGVGVLEGFAPVRRRRANAGPPSVASDQGSSVAGNPASTSATARREVRMIKGLHHNAYRCRDSEKTRGFYEDFLGLRFVSAFEIDEGRGMHSFFEMDDGSCLAFFEVPGKPFEFKRQDTLDLHIALDVESEVFDRMLNKAQAEGVEVRGPVDHGFVRSIYMRDPNGYVIELTASTGVQQEIMDPAISKPREALARWQAAKGR